MAYLARRLHVLGCGQRDRVSFFNINGDDIMSDTKRMTSVDVQAHTVHVIRQTRHVAKAEPVLCSWTFNYDGCSEQELLELATAEMVIRQQRVWRELDADDRKEKAQGSIDVADFLRTTRERGPIVPTAKSVGKQIAKLSDEERAELLKQLDIQ